MHPTITLFKEISQQLQITVSWSAFYYALLLVVVF